MKPKRKDLYMPKLIEILENPNNINCDNEFNTHEFNELMDYYDVKVWYSDPGEINKNAIVERVNGTIAKMQNKILSKQSEKNS